MEPKVVRRLEQELEDAIADVIVRMGLKKLPLLACRSLKVRQSHCRRRRPRLRNCSLLHPNMASKSECRDIDGTTSCE